MTMDIREFYYGMFNDAQEEIKAMKEYSAIANMAFHVDAPKVAMDMKAIGQAFQDIGREEAIHYERIYKMIRHMNTVIGKKINYQPTCPTRLPTPEEIGMTGGMVGEYYSNGHGRYSNGYSNGGSSDIQKAISEIVGNIEIEVNAGAHYAQVSNNLRQLALSCGDLVDVSRDLDMMADAFLEMSGQENVHSQRITRIVEFLRGLQAESLSSQMEIGITAMTGENGHSYRH
jgi:rubrerythrin